MPCIQLYLLKECLEAPENMTVFMKVRWVRLHLSWKSLLYHAQVSSPMAGELFLSISTQRDRWGFMTLLCYDIFVPPTPREEPGLVEVPIALWGRAHPDWRAKFTSPYVPYFLVWALYSASILSKRYECGPSSEYRCGVRSINLGLGRVFRARPLRFGHESGIHYWLSLASWCGPGF